jgi:hypothetical protein
MTMRAINPEWHELAKGYRLITQLEPALQNRFMRPLKIAQRRKSGKVAAEWQAKSISEDGALKTLRSASLAVVGVVTLLSVALLLFGYGLLAVILDGLAFIAARRIVSQKSRSVTMLRAQKPAPENEEPVPLDILRQWWQTIAFVPPRSIEKLGDIGEREFLAMLQSRLPDTYCAVTNVLVARNLDADMVLVGPTGIWILESKYWSGKIKVRQGIWRRTKTYYEPGGTLANKEEDLESFALQWAREMNAVVKIITTKLPSLSWLAFSIEGGLVFTHPDVELDIDDSCRVAYGKVDYWVEQILDHALIPDLSTEESQLQIIDVLVSSGDTFKANQSRSSASALAQTLYDSTAQKAEAFVAENCRD